MTEETQTNETQNLVQDVAPLIEEPKPFEVAGKPHTMRHLSVKDTFKVARLLATGAASMNKHLAQMQLNDEGTVQTLLIAAFIYAETDTINFLCSLINVKYEDFTNPEFYPMGSELEVMEQLLINKDFNYFLAKVGGLIQRLPEAMNTKPATV